MIYSFHSSNAGAVFSPLIFVHRTSKTTTNVAQQTLPKLTRAQDQDEHRQQNH